MPKRSRHDKAARRLRSRRVRERQQASRTGFSTGVGVVLGMGCATLALTAIGFFAFIALVILL